MNKNRKIFILSLFIVVVLIVFYVVPAFAGASISLTGDAWDLGAVKASVIVNSSSSYSGGPGTWSVTNNSGGSEELNIKVNSSGNWTADNTVRFNTPADALGINKFGLLLTHAADQSYTTSITALSETDVGIFSQSGTYMGNNEILTFNLRFISPPVGSEEGTHTLTITITAVNWHTFVCGDNFAVNHTTAAGVAAENKLVAYGTVLTNLSGENKCWITRNLGASTKAGWAADNSESAAGWYWQFNRKQGYKHDGTTRTPATTWITDAPEAGDWADVNDPCTIELGTGWRLPTSSEWTNVVTNGNWVNSDDFYASVLKLHMAGYLKDIDGSLFWIGQFALYRSSSGFPPPTNAAYGLYYYAGEGQVINSHQTISKIAADSVRCIKD